jgi:hypothetical protein
MFSQFGWLPIIVKDVSGQSVKQTYFIAATFGWSTYSSIIYALLLMFNVELGTCK